MALIKCPECGKEISDKAEYCIHCGYPLVLRSVDKDDFADDESSSIQGNLENTEQNDNNVQEEQSTTQADSIESTEGFSSHANEVETQQKSPSKGLSEGTIIAIVAIALVIFFLWIFPAMNTTSGGRKCAWCGGTGYSGNGAKNAAEYVLRKTTCSHCHGTGRR